jgi:hypothetical protein
MQRILKPELKTAASPALLERGCVVLIGLEQIRDQAGRRWEKMRPSIYAHLESLLRQKLGPADYYAQVDDLSFLVSMPSASADEAQILCLRVAHELHSSLLGPCQPGQLHVARATRLDGDTLQCELTKGADLARLAAQALHSANTGSVVRWTGEKRPPTTHNPVLSIKYIPLWDTHNEAITTYRCVATDEQSRFQIASAQVLFKSNLNALLHRIHAATTTLAQKLSKGERFLISLPIEYELLSSPVVRMEVGALCRGLAAALRPYLQFEISELPYGVPQSRLLELVGSLRPFCRNIWAHLPARIPSYGAYQNIGLHAIGLSLEHCGTKTSEIEAELSTVCAAAQRMHARSFALDIPNLDTLLMARDMKVSMVSGSLIGEPADQPAPISRLPLSQLLRNAANRDCADGGGTRAVAI